MNTRRSGFTIVELLIVIVVVGILAAITIVAYNGIQSRARDAQRMSDVKQIANGLRRYAIEDNGIFNTSGAGYVYVTVARINTKSPATSGYSSISIKDFLVGKGYIKNDLKEPAYVYEGRDYVVTLCKDSDANAPFKNRRIVMATLDNAPAKTLAQQFPQCGGSGEDYWFNIFQTYGGANYGEMVDAQ